VPSATTNRRRPLLVARLVLALFVFLLCGVIAEVGLRLLWKPQLATWQRNIKRTIDIDPAILHGVVGPVHINTNSKGIRGDDWSNDRSKEYRILAIGGSTTECLFNDQPNTWPALLQTRLGTVEGRKVWVGNAGHAGFTSRHNVLEMRHMPDQYDPDAVVILVGGNDMGLLLDDGAGYDPGFINNPDKMGSLSMDFVERPVSIIKSTTRFHHLYLTMFARETLRLYQSPRGLLNTGQNWATQMELRRHPWLVVQEMPYDISPGLKSYESNLREIARLAKQRHIRLILMTQPELYQTKLSPEMMNQIWSGWIGDPSANIYWSPEVAGKVLEAHNESTLKICREEQIECIDLASTIPKSLDVFFDHAHFTDYGCSLVADALVNHFRHAAAAK